MTLDRRSPWAIDDLRCEYLVAPLGIDEPRPRLSWRLRARARGERQSAYRVLVATDPALLAPGRCDLWDSGKVASDRSVHVAYAGAPLPSATLCHCKVVAWNRDGRRRAVTTSTWETGLLAASDWEASWIGRPGGRGPAYLRREFVLDAKPITRARLYATALGVYEVELGSRPAGKARFTPGWTDYRQRIQYQTYDVTGLVRAGANAIGATLAGGWYAGAIGWAGRRRHYGGPPLALLARLAVTYADGSRTVVVTDRSWKAGRGPVRAADFLMGEDYDARRELPGWTEPGFDDAAWDDAIDVSPPGARLVAQRSPTVQPVREVAPVAIREPEPGLFVFDLGQNIGGWARLRVGAPRGTRIRLRFAEALEPDGRIHTANLRRARARDTYVAAGRGVETWEPRFTFHGFRYVEVAGLPARPARNTVTGIVAHSALPLTGRFSCSNDLVNRLHRNIVWTQRANFVSIPTDCPQRDERLGWLGDAQVFAPTACFNMDVAPFFTKWIDDIRDAQSAEGGFPDVAPRVVTRQSGAPGWGDAGVILPWTVWVHYGDRRILERSYPSMQRWVSYVHGANPDLLWRRRVGHGYGDWVAVDEATPADVVATAYFARSVDLTGKTARVLGRRADAEHYEDLARRIRAAFRAAYVGPGARIEGDTQTCYVLALAFDLLPPEQRRAAARRLVADIAGRGGHLSTGFLGVADLLPVLAEHGHLGTAYRLLLGRTFPSWGYMIDHGATTIWERWDGWTEAAGFQTPAMNSFNHYALGSVGAWVYRSVAGLGVDPGDPGYRHVLVRPRPGGRLRAAAASLDSMHGRVAVAWRRGRGRFELDVLVPVGAHATVWVPARDPASVREGGRPAKDRRGVHFAGATAGHAVYRVLSGRYRFRSGG